MSKSAPRPKKPKSPNVPRPRAVKALPAKKHEPYHVQFGSIRTNDTHHTFDTEAKAKTAIRKAVEQHRRWCQVYNSAGLAVLDQTLAAVGSLVFEREPVTINELLDEHYQVRIHIVVWRTT